MTRKKTNKTALFMGRSLYTRRLIELPGENGMLTIGGARGGKGACASIPNLLLWPHSVLVIDVKGTHAKVTAEFRRKVLKQKVCVVDPYGVVPDQKSACFDPLATVRQADVRDIRERIAVIADALVVANPGVKDPFWDDSARAVITGLIGHMLTSPDFRDVSLSTIRNLMTLDPDQQSYLWADMLLNEAAGGAAKDTAARIMRGAGTNEILGILSNVDKHSDWLSYEPIKELFAPDPSGKNSFTFAEMKEKPMTIYLVLPPDKLDIHKRFLRLFVNLAINQMSIGGRAKVPVLMILDEFASLGFMSEVIRAFRLLASYNLMLWVFLQELGALKDIYKSSADAVIQNSRGVQVFAVSDEISTKFASDRIGQRSMHFVRGISDARQTPPLRTPSEVAEDVSADCDCQYILRAGQAPLYLKKVRYYEDRLHWKADANMPAWLMQRRYPFFGRYDNDPDFS